MSAPRTDVGPGVAPGGPRSANRDPVALGPEALALLSDYLIANPIVRRSLNMYLEAHGLDHTQNWRLALTAGVLVAEDSPAAGEGGG